MSLVALNLLFRYYNISSRYMYLINVLFPINNESILGGKWMKHIDIFRDRCLVGVRHLHVTKISVSYYKMFLKKIPQIKTQKNQQSKKKSINNNSWPLLLKKKVLNPWSFKAFLCTSTLFILLIENKSNRQ